jgi:hypothetical protein
MSGELALLIYLLRASYGSTLVPFQGFRRSPRKKTFRPYSEGHPLVLLPKKDRAGVSQPVQYFIVRSLRPDDPDTTAAFRRCHLPWP